MKKILSLPFIICVLFISCDKGQSETQKNLEDTNAKEYADKGCIKVKYIRQFCNDVVLQIQDPAYYHLGADGWLNEVNGAKYDHVFLTGYCGLKSKIDQLNMTGAPTTPAFYVELGTPVIPADCATCAALMPNPPSKSQVVKLSTQCQ